MEKAVFTDEITEKAVRIACLKARIIIIKTDNGNIYIHR